jgi:hypothetical protein
MVFNSLVFLYLFLPVTYFTFWRRVSRFLETDSKAANDSRFGGLQRLIPAVLPSKIGNARLLAERWVFRTNTLSTTISFG